MHWTVVCVVFLALAGLVRCQRKLGRYKVDRSKISVSGVSAGGAMATQVHVAYSSIFSGVGIIAAPPYYCFMNVRSNWRTCWINYDDINITVLTGQTLKYESSGMIDPTENMLNDRVYIFHGMNDTVILQANNEVR